jgi:hypothetical protein
MPRYTMIDEHSGFVWGDAEAENPIEACRALDRQLGDHENHTYTDIGGARFNGQSGYHVYLSPEEFTNGGDGQDPEYIKMVESFKLIARIAKA